MSATINVKPYTAWNILDYIIIQISEEGEKICNNRISSDTFYNALIDLICKESINELPKQIIIAKPFYPYILLSYYILFHRGNLSIAKALYERLLKAYLNYPSTFDKNEKVSLKILGEVIELFEILRGLNKDIHRKHLQLHFEVLMAKLNRISCLKNGWSYLFKELILSHLDLEHSYEKLRYIINITRTNFRHLDEELIEGYNLFVPEASSPIYFFLLNISERELNNLDKMYEKIRELEREKKKKQERLDKIIEIQRTLHIYVEESEKTVKKALVLLPFIGGLALGALTTIFGLLGIIPMILLWSTYSLKLIEKLTKRKISRIEEEIHLLLSSRMEKFAKIIWSS